ncbi:dihydropteroate synthase [Planctomicrobium sp. SH661]|uniref:dihydropteroate synthase n=1 Tax=Planctomicrobium sp. SH661 TaxID=3448124 RepID=UPI003F5B37AA
MTVPSKSSILRSWKFAQQCWQMGDAPRLMGIVNATPDSFSDGGKWTATPAAVEHALSLAESGADVLDIGGESTRPNADPVSDQEELRRVIPVIEQLASKTGVPISIDTTKGIVAREALAAGASIVNDISGLTFDPEMPEVCAASDCGVILMHIQGTPKTMQLDPRYDNAVVEIRDWLRARCEFLEAAGISRERLMVDPGIGFGKTAQHNLEILSHVGEFRSFGRPVLIGHSRKGFLKKLVGRDVDERLAGTIGVSLALAHQHADLLRVHDVWAVRDALAAWKQILSVREENAEMT